MKRKTALSCFGSVPAEPDISSTHTHTKKQIKKSYCKQHKQQHTQESTAVFSPVHTHNNTLKQGNQAFSDPLINVIHMDVDSMQLQRNN